LQEHAKVERATAYARLTNFGADAIEIEVFAYVLTPEPELFRSIREELLLQIASVVEAAGSALAPTRFIEMGPGANGVLAARVDRPQPGA
jgi:MscS family membrane protein